MKLAVNEWRVLVLVNGTYKDDSYYGYKTKKLALEQVEKYQQNGIEAIVKKEK